LFLSFVNLPALVRAGAGIFLATLFLWISGPPANCDVALRANILIAPAPAFASVVLEHDPQKVVLDSGIND
jgi:hypothetical protein